MKGNQIVMVPYTTPPAINEYEIDWLAETFYCDDTSVEFLHEEEFTLSDVQEENYFILGYFWKE